MLAQALSVRRVVHKLDKCVVLAKAGSGLHKMEGRCYTRCRFSAAGLDLGYNSSPANHMMAVEEAVKVAKSIAGAGYQYRNRIRHC
jgi:hypothetical protein